MQERNLCLQGIKRFFANQIFPGFTYVRLYNLLQAFFVTGL